MLPHPNGRAPTVKTAVTDTKAIVETVTAMNAVEMTVESENGVETVIGDVRGAENVEEVGKMRMAIFL